MIRSRWAAMAVVASLSTAACASTVHGQGAVTGGAPKSTSSGDFPSASTSPSAGGSSAGTSAASSAPAATASAPAHPAPSSPIATRTVHTADGTAYVVKIWARVQNATCFDHAYGQAMIEFLTKHPCGGLQRILATTTVKGRPVGFAQSATSFTGTAKDPYKWAGAFAKLEQQNGTGSINDLLREGYRLPQGPTSVPASEAFNVLGQDNGVTVWDVWYLDGPTPANDKPLIKMTQDLFLLV